MQLDPFHAILRDDVHGGAAEVGRHAAQALEAELAARPAVDGHGLRQELTELCRRMMAAQPAMAPLVALGAAAIGAIPPDASEAEARAAAGSAMRAFAQRLASAARQIAARSQALIPAGGRVLALSGSSTVRETVLEAARRRFFEIVCLEGRPNLEGRVFAAALANAGVPVRLAVDAAAGTLAAESDLVLVGADSIGDAGFVNKIGTHALALGARTAGIPFYVLSDWSKVLPPGWPQSVQDDRPAAEVWDGAPEGVRIWNRYFEVTPLPLVTGVISEAGLCTPAELEERRARMRLPAELRPPGAR